MQRLAEELAEGSFEQMFGEDLNILAERLKIPRLPAKTS